MPPQNGGLLGTARTAQSGCPCSQHIAHFLRQLQARGFVGMCRFTSCLHRRAADAGRSLLQVGWEKL